MMRLVASFTTALLLLGGVPAGAQTGKSDNTGNSSNKVLDVLNNLLRGDRSLRGHVVLTRDNELVLRGDDARTYSVDTAGVDSRNLGSLAPGQAVTVKLRAGQGEALIAESVQTEAGATQPYQKVEGTVQSVSGTRATFRTREGLTIPVDLSRVVGRTPPLTANEPATLYYEPEAQSSIVAVWLEPQRAMGSTTPGGPSASPSTSSGAASSGAASPTTSLPPSAGSPGVAGTTGEYQRLHGYVESVGLGTLSIRSDDGRTVTVDTSLVGDQTRQGVRPGDLVSVVGKSSGADRFVAEVLQKDAGR